MNAELLSSQSQGDVPWTLKFGRLPVSLVKSDMLDRSHGRQVKIGHPVALAEEEPSWPSTYDITHHTELSMETSEAGSMWDIIYIKTTRAAQAKNGGPDRGF